MKVKDEKSPLNKPNQRLLIVAGLAFGGLLLAVLLYNLFKPAPPQPGAFDQQVRSGDARFLRNDPPPEEPEPETDIRESEVQMSDLPPPESIFQRPRTRPKPAVAETSARPEQLNQQRRQQEPDRHRELYEQALSSSIKVGGAVSLPGQQNEGAAFQPTSPDRRNGQGWRTQREVTEFESPVTPYSIMEGTLIEATLQTAITSALPGNIVGIVNRDVFDSVRQNHLLIPRGTRLIGSYESSIAFDQRKLMMSWDRIIFPDGRSMNLPGVPTHDLMGMSGLGGDVKTHFWSTFGQSAMLSLIGASASFAISGGGGGGFVGGFGGLTARETIAMQVARDFQRVANQLLQRNMNRQPTIEIEAGTPFTIFVLDDIFFAEPFELTYLE
ncbi:MAG: TrbI/VirB10 family protein [Balneolaceae bacterium]|nr:TrbI/VirB10 family protein [Balneolaceae bacterium]